MPATVFPVPITTGHVLQQLVGLGDLLAAQATYAGRTQEDILASHSRAAQGQIETTTSIPFFNTRYATRPYAQRLNLVLGTDFDRYYNAGDYDVEEWVNGTARMDLPWLPLNDVLDVTLQLHGDTGNIATIPLDWVERDDEHGIVHIIPHGAGIGLQIYYKLFGVSPFARAGMAGIVPQIVHVRFNAGLVQLPSDMSTWSDWDPLDAPELTDFWPELVEDYQRVIGQIVAARLMREVSSWLDRGGVSVSIDGLSESVNPGVLTERATAAENLATQWTELKRDEYRGVVVAFA